MRKVRWHRTANVTEVATYHLSESEREGSGVLAVLATRSFLDENVSHCYSVTVQLNGSQLTCPAAVFTGLAQFHSGHDRPWVATKVHARHHHGQRHEHWCVSRGEWAVCG